MFHFGSGDLIGAATTDAFGNTIANPTPVKFGVLQNVSLDISFDVKELYGQGQFAVAVGRGKGKIGGKASFAQINGFTLNSLFFGQTLAAGIINDVIDVTGAVISASPSTITPTIPGAGTWVNDLGVVNAAGVPLRRVVTGPTAGQYSVAAGVYTFATADAGQTVFTSFQYTATSTVAQMSTVKNVPMGYAPFFRADLHLSYGGKSLIFTLPQALATKLSFATKIDDFMLPDFEFSGFADPLGNVLTYGVSE